MREQDPYTIILRWSKQEHTYLGQVQDLVGVEGTGSSYEEALASTLEAMRWWREMSSEGEPSPVSQMLMEDQLEPDEGEEPPLAR